MANYTTNASDKSKDKALKLFYCGGFGILGLHYFYVGRYKRGFTHLGIAFFAFIIMGIVWGSSVHTETGLPVTLGQKIAPTIILIILLAAVNIPTLIRMLSGSFRDNVGNPLR